MELAYFDDNASTVPFVWMMTGLVLDSHSVAFGELTPLVT